MKLTIGHLYPDLLNLYGDRGNIQCLRKRLEWRGMEAEVREFLLEDPIPFQELDIVLLGGGSDREQRIVCQKLQGIQKDFKAYVEDGGTVIAVCGGYQLLGHYYDTDQGRMEGLSLVDLYTEQGSPGSSPMWCWKVRSFPPPSWALRTTAVGRISTTTSPWGRCCSATATTARTATKGCATKMWWAPTFTALCCPRILRSATCSWDRRWSASAEMGRWRPCLTWRNGKPTSIS